MNIIVNDANILIDLIKLEIIDLFFKIDYEMHITDFVFNECNIDQQNVMMLYVKKNMLTIDSSEFDELSEIDALNLKYPQLSFPDCSVYYVAKIMNAILFDITHNVPV